MSETTASGGRGVTLARLVDAWLLPLMLFATLLALVAGVTLFLFPDRTDTNFSWPITSPMAAAFLGSGYLAGAVALIAFARDRSWPVLRAGAYALLAFSILVTAATLIHIDRFRMDAWEGWFWTVFYVLFVPAVVAFIVINERARRATPVGDPAIGPALRAFFTVTAALAAAAIAGLWLAPDRIASLWPWPLTPLTARMSAATFAGICTGSLFSLGRVFHARIMTFGLGVFGVLILLAIALRASDVAFERPLTWVALAWALACVVFLLPIGARWELRRSENAPLGTERGDA